MKNKVLILGNEFFKEDSLAKKLSIHLKKNKINIVSIRDSFHLMQELINSKNKGENLIILDVVKGINKICFIKKDDLRINKLNTSHDLDAGFLISILNVDPKILGIPIQFTKIENNIEKIAEEIKNMIINS